MKASVLLSALCATLLIGLAGCASRAEKAAVAAPAPQPIATYTAPSAPPPATTISTAPAPAPVETTVAQAPTTMGAAPAEPAPRADRN